MKRIILLLSFALLNACTLFRLEPVREQEVIITDPPNKLLAPFICGDESIDVSCTVKKY